MPIEIEEFITQRRVEEAFRQGRIAQARRRQSFADTGFRAARAKDPRLMLALDKGSELLRQLSEQQFGMHGMDAGARRVEATEYQLWREAYIAADRGDPIRSLEWIYGMAAWLAGLVI